MEEYTGRNYHAVTRYGSKTSEARFQLYINGQRKIENPKCTAKCKLDRKSIIKAYIHKHKITLTIKKF